MATHADKKFGDTNETEVALLQRIAKHDRDAITELYQIYHGRLFKFIFRLTHSYTAADELVNDIMLIVWQKAPGFRGNSKVSTWIFGIAYRQAMRRLRRKQITPLGSTDPDAVAGDDRSTMETEDWVRRGLEALPAAQQLTMVLVYYLGLSCEETAALTECPVNTVKTRMFHARRKLREYLAATATAGIPVDDDLNG